MPLNVLLHKSAVEPIRRPVAETRAAMVQQQTAWSFKTYERPGVHHLDSTRAKKVHDRGILSVPVRRLGSPDNIAILMWLIPIGWGLCPFFQGVAL